MAEVLHFPIAQLDCQTAFNNLTSKERLYAYWMSEASWQGSLITLEQVSPESREIFDMFQILFSIASPEVLEKLARSNDVSPENFQLFMVRVRNLVRHIQAYNNNINN
jgi:dipeptidyl-peptidase-3